MGKSLMGRFRKKSQVTIPKSIVEEYDLSEGDRLQFIKEEDGVKIRPVEFIPKTQKWFWTDKWQEKEKEANQALENGEIEEFDSSDELIKELRNGD